MHLSLLSTDKSANANVIFAVAKGVIFGYTISIAHSLYTISSDQTGGQQAADDKNQEHKFHFNPRNYLIWTLKV